MSDSSNQKKPSRREAIKRMMGIPVIGGLASLGMSAGFVSNEERHLAAEETAPKVDAVTGATRTSWELPKLDELQKKVPHAELCGLDVSRLIMGGNLIGGWAHARDLIYVSDLVKNYHTKEKVFQTFRLAEECGINTFSGNPVMADLLDEYWTKLDGKIQFISDCGYGGMESMPDNVKKAIDFGSDLCYLHGGVTDEIVKAGRFEIVEKCYDVMRDAGYPTGIAAHYQSTLDGLTQAGLEPDFFMKTYHELSYWSAKAPSEHDNVFCREPEKTRAYMESRDQPWIAYKVLAAGAIAPESGFRAALEAGGDFLCVGMYDFQMVADVNQFCSIFDSVENRRRRMLPGSSEE